MVALRAKSVRMTDLVIELVEHRCAGLGLALASPREAAERGSQVCFAHAHAWPVMQALIARGVVGDVRAGADGDADILRFGFAPLVETLRDVLATRAWDRPQFMATKAVT